MRNKILLGTGIAAIVAGIGGLFAADNVKKNNKLITIVSGIVAVLGLILAAIVLDKELYPDEFIEEEEENSEEVETEEA